MRNPFKRKPTTVDVDHAEWRGRQHARALAIRALTQHQNDTLETSHPLNTIINKRRAKGIQEAIDIIQDQKQNDQPPWHNTSTGTSSGPHLHFETPTPRGASPASVGAHWPHHTGKDYK